MQKVGDPDVMEANDGILNPTQETKDKDKYTMMRRLAGVFIYYTKLKSGRDVMMKLRSLVSPQGPVEDYIGVNHHILTEGSHGVACS